MRASLVTPRLVLTLAPLLCLTACDGVGPGGLSDAGTIASVGVTPSAASLVPNEPLRLEGVPLDISRNPLELPVTWSTSDPTVATVSSDGMVTAATPGTATITASSEGLSAASNITVTDGGFLGADGGVVSAFGGSVSLVVPTGALASPLPIHVEPVAPDDPDATIVGAPFRIRVGVSFAQPATLTVAYDPALAPAGVPEEQLGLRVRPLGGQPRSALGTVDPSSHTATAVVTTTAVYDVGRIASQAPCVAPEYRQFDFWLGRWRVAPSDAAPGARQAASLITVEPGGCAIFEDFRDLATHGVSISVYDPTVGAWYQTFVDNNGTRLVLRGGLTGGDMLLTAPTSDHRITWSAAGGTVRQVGESSLDGGQSWDPEFDLIYQR